MSNASVWPMDRTLSGATRPGQSGPGSDGNKWALCIPQSSCITGVSASDYFVSYTGHSLGESYSSAQLQSLYSAAVADWATCWGNLTTQQRWGRCILQLQPTGLCERVAFWFVNACSINKKTNHDMWGNRVLFTIVLFTIERLLVDKNIELVNTG